MKTQISKQPIEPKLSSEEKATVQESSSSMETGVSESAADTLEELVDQMEIEISDHGDDGEGDETLGEESQDESPQDDSQHEVEEKVGVADKASEKIQSSTTVSGDSGSTAGKTEAKPKSEALQLSRKRRHSSSRHDKAEFLPISIENQLSDDEIIELMELLQVHCTYIHVHVHIVHVHNVQKNVCVRKYFGPC